MSQDPEGRAAGCAPRGAGRGVTESQALGPLLAAAEERVDPYAERILEAARQQFMAFGLRRTSLDDIARAAKVSRATLFRRFPNREALLLALVAREAQRSIAAVDAQLASIEDPEAFLLAGALGVIRQITGNGLVQRLLVTDTEQMLRLFTVDSGPILTMGRGYIAGHLRRLCDEGAPIVGDPDVVAEILARITLSLTLNPEGTLRLDDDDEFARIARTSIVPLVLGPR